MFSKVWLINFVLVAIVVSIAFQAVNAWTQKDNPLPGRTVAGKQEKPVQQVIAPQKREPNSAYDLIAEKTLFSDTRAEFIPEPEVNGPGEPSAEQTRRPVFLYGTVIAGDYRKALVKESGGESGEDRWVYVGDRIAGMNVQVIEKEKLLLSSDTDTLEVFLYDRTKPRAIYRPQQADTPSVVTLSSDKDPAERPERKNKKPDSGEQQKPVGQESSAAKSDPQESATVVKREADNHKTVSDKPETGSLQTSPFQPQSKDNADIPPPQSGKGEFEIIQTPFGKIQRKIQ